MSRSRTTDLMRTLAEAARVAQRAPSVFNTQPWIWRIGSHALDLLRDPARQLAVTDTDARQLTISCGAALHHARIALAAAQRRVTVTRFPDPDRPNLLARLEVRGRAEPDPQILRWRGAIPRRRTDRRGFAAAPVPPAVLSHFQAVAEAEGCALHVIGRDQMATLTMATTSGRPSLPWPATRGPRGHGGAGPHAPPPSRRGRPIRLTADRDRRPPSPVRCHPGH